MLIYLDRDLERVGELMENAERNGREEEDFWLLESVAWAWIDFGDCRRALPIFQLIQEQPGQSIDVSEGLNYCKDQMYLKDKTGALLERHLPACSGSCRNVTVAVHRR